MSSLGFLQEPLATGAHSGDARCKAVSSVQITEEMQSAEDEHGGHHAQEKADQPPKFRRLVPVNVVHSCARVYFIVHVLVFGFIALDQLEVCGEDEGCKNGPILSDPQQCEKPCPQRDGPLSMNNPNLWQRVQTNFSQGVCPYDFPVCYNSSQGRKFCVRSSLEAGHGAIITEFVLVALMCAVFAVFSSNGNMSARGWDCADSQARLALLGVGVLVNFDYHFMKQAQGWPVPNAYRSLLPFTSCLNYLIIAGFMFCTFATMLSQAPGHGCEKWVQWSHLLSLVYLATCFISADFIDSDSFSGDPLFVGIGPIWWFTMAFDSNEHAAYLTGSKQSGNYMIPFSAALFVWKAVVGFLFGNVWQFGHCFDLIIPFAKLVLLTLDTISHNSVTERRMFITPDNDSGYWERWKALSRSWGFLSLLQFVNFLWNSIYIGATLNTQVSKIQESEKGWRDTPPPFAKPTVVYGILVLSLVGTVGTAAGFVCACKRWQYVFDEKFRFSVAVKNSMLWLKILLLWDLTGFDKTNHQADESWNTIIILINNFITVVVATVAARGLWSVSVQSDKMMQEVHSPGLFGAAFVPLVFSWKGTVTTLMLAKFLRSPFLAEVPSWDIPALPAFWVIVFGALELEVSRYKESCREQPEFYAEKDVRAMRCMCLWAAFVFPLNLACSVFIPAWSTVFWQSLFGNTAKGSAGIHIWMSSLIIITFLSMLVMAVIPKFSVYDRASGLHIMDSSVPHNVSINGGNDQVQTWVSMPSLRHMSQGHGAQNKRPDDSNGYSPLHTSSPPNNATPNF